MLWENLHTYSYLWLFVGLGLLISGLLLRLSAFLRPHAPNQEKSSSYECGENSLFMPSKGFGLRYLCLALLFVIFELESILLFPWARYWGTVREASQLLFLVAELGVFVLFLLLGLAYAYRKGALQWAMQGEPQSTTPTKAIGLPSQSYHALQQTLNQSYSKSSIKSI